MCFSTTDDDSTAVEAAAAAAAAAEDADADAEEDADSVLLASSFAAAACAAAAAAAAIAAACVLACACRCCSFLRPLRPKNGCQSAVRRTPAHGSAGNESAAMESGAKSGRPRASRSGSIAMSCS